MILSEVVMPIYSETERLWSQSSLFESITDLCHHSYSEIVTLQLNGICNGDVSTSSNAYFASPSDVFSLSRFFYKPLNLSARF